MQMPRRVIDHLQRRLATLIRPLFKIIALLRHLVGDVREAHNGILLRLRQRIQRCRFHLDRGHCVVLVGKNRRCANRASAAMTRRVSSWRHSDHSDHQDRKPHALRVESLWLTHPALGFDEAGLLTRLYVTLRQAGVSRLPAQPVGEWADGAVWADSFESLAANGNLLDRPEVRDALALGQGANERHSVSTGDEMFYVAVPLRPRGASIGVARVGVPLTTIAQAQNHLAVTVLAGALLAAAIALALAVLIARRWRAPI
jgi:hypothetical protein